MIETQRLILRHWHFEDAARLCELAKDKHVGPACGWAPHQNVQESKEVLASILMKPLTFAIVAKGEQQIIGNISLMMGTDSHLVQNLNQAEIGFWLGYSYWGKGYMPEACRAIMEYGLVEVGLDTLWISHVITNENSKRVQNKCGFKFSYQQPISDHYSGDKTQLVVNSIKKEDFIGGTY